MKVLLFALIILSGSCTKESDSEVAPQDSRKAEDFRNQWHDKKFQISAYYSEVPIDYDTSGVLKTDLFEFVSDWIRDDLSLITGETVIIQQNAKKVESEPSETLVRQFKVLADQAGVKVSFVDHQYVNLDYRLVDFSDTAFTLYAYRGKNKVFSRFRVK